MTNSVVEPKTITANQLSQLIQRTAKKYSSTIFLEVINPQLDKISGNLDTQLKMISDFMTSIRESKLTADVMATSLMYKMRVAMDIFDEYCSFCKLNINLLSEPIKSIECNIAECEKNIQKSTLKNAALNYYQALEYSSLMINFVEALNLTRASLTQSLIENNIAIGPAQNKVVYFALKLGELLELSKDTFSNIAANALNNKTTHRR